MSIIKRNCFNRIAERHHAEYFAEKIIEWKSCRIELQTHYYNGSLLEPQGKSICIAVEILNNVLRTAELKRIEKKRVSDECVKFKTENRMCVNVYL